MSINNKVTYILLSCDRKDLQCWANTMLSSVGARELHKFVTRRSLCRSRSRRVTKQGIFREERDREKRFYYFAIK